MVEFEDAVSERMAQLEREDLERYQREIDLQRMIVRMRRPIQRSEMRVPDYYRHFCYWKEDMISVGYPDDESSYIDDFLGNLQWHIQLRISNRRLRISRLVDAYYEAKFEETTVLLERMVKDLKAANEINEMDDRLPTEIQEDNNCDSVDEEAIENSQQAEPYVEKAHQLFDDMPRSLSIDLKEEDGDSDGAGAYDEQYPVVELQSNDYVIKSAEDGHHFTDKLLPNSFVKYEETEQNEENDCVVLGKMDSQIDADKVFVEMTGPVLEEDLLGIGVTKATHNMLNGRPILSPIDSDADLYKENGPLSSFSYTIELSIGDNGCQWISGLMINVPNVSIQDLSYRDDVLGDSETNSPSLPRLRFNPQVFDPGTLKLSKQEEYESQLDCISSELFLNYSQVYCEFSDYNHLVIELGCCLLEWANSRDNKIDWVLSCVNGMKGSTSSLKLVHSTIVSGNKHCVIAFDHFHTINSGRHVIFPWIAHIDYIEADLNTLIDSELLLKKISFDPGGCPMSILNMYEQSTLIEMNEGNVVDGGVVLSVIDLQAALGPLGDTAVNRSSNGSTKAWFEGAELIIEVVLCQNAMKKTAGIMVVDIPPTFRAGAKNEQLMAPYIRGINSNQLTLFDPGGKNCVVGMSSGIVLRLITEVPETSIAGLQGMDGMLMFIFDPGIDFLPLTGFAPLKSSEMPSSSIVALWFAKVLFYFNLYSCCLFYNGCDYSEFKVDPSTGANKFQLNENIGQRNLYGSMLFPSEVYFVYTTSDQASPRLNNGHNVSAGNTKVHFTTADMLSQRVPFEDKYCFIDFSHFGMFVSDSPVITYLVSDSIAQGDSLSKSLFEGESSKLLSTLLSCWTVSLDRLTFELGFMSSFESRIGLCPFFRVNFVWDPGQEAISFYIIEDNDVLKRKGILIQLACALKQDDVKLSMVAMQMAQMLQLVEYVGYPYDHGSYTILASENTCHANLYPSSNVAYTNVVQGDENEDVQNGAAVGTWLQLRNEDSGGGCFLFGAHLRIMSNIKADYHLLKKCRDKLLLPFWCHLVSFLAFQNPCCVLCCCILRL